jgi:hypothetical protein
MPLRTRRSCSVRFSEAVLSCGFWLVGALTSPACMSLDLFHLMSCSLSNLSPHFSVGLPLCLHSLRAQRRPGLLVARRFPVRDGPIPVHRPGVAGHSHADHESYAANLFAYSSMRQTQRMSSFRTLYRCSSHPHFSDLFLTYLDACPHTSAHLLLLFSVVVEPRGAHALPGGARVRWLLLLQHALWHV